MHIHEKLKEDLKEWITLYTNEGFFKLVEDLHLPFSELPKDLVDGEDINLAIKLWRRM
tara:strand:- start:73 stop:246 length:174 start_codon:yes stop_codon:yes gene_type:complete